MTKKHEEIELLSIQEFFNRFPVFKLSEIAKLAKLSATSVTYYKTGDRSPSEYTLKQLNKAIQKIAKDLENVEIF
jgi:transcriptional regulator with XRE-family HTH domain